MTAPAGVVDLSLPDYPTLVARAGVDPRAEAARVAGADPGTVAGAGALLGRAGGEMDGAYTRSLGAADTLGRAFTNAGAPVLDRATHVGNLPAGFGDAGARLAGTSRRVGAVADDLTVTMRQTADVVTGLDGDLSAAASAWASRVAAAGTSPNSGSGLIPQEAIPALLAERDRIATQMAGLVSDAGRRVVERIRGYEVVVNEALRLLADHGFVPPAELDAPPPPPPPRADEGVDPAGLGTPLMAGYAADPVNTALGNFVEVETDLPFGGLLAGLTFARTYNSRSDRSGPFGARWASWATTRLIERTWTAEFEGPDGQRIAFPRTGSGFGRAVGVDALVERSAAGLALAWFDGRRWEFDTDGRPVRTWAGPGTAVRFVHEDDRLVELVHEHGRTVTVEWADGRVVAVSGSDGRRVDYRYADGGLAEAAGPAGARRYDRDEAGRVVSVTDADGVVELVNTYDEQGRVLTQRSSFGRLVTFGYGEPDGTTVVADDSAGPTNVYRHDGAGRLVALTDGHGHTLRKRYDEWGNPVEIVERGGGVTRQEFDGRGHLVRRTTPSGAVFTVAWDDADRVVAITAAGAPTRFSYAGAERIPSEIVDPEGGVTRLHVAGGLVQAVTDPDGVTVRLRHDSDGHLVEAVDAAGGVARIERDAAGLPSAVVTPAGRRTELVHDGHGRLVERRDPAGGVWRYEYSAAGRRTAVVDPTGSRTETSYGAHGAAAELVDALGAVTTQGYDVFGNLADRTDADGGKWAFRHDALSRLTAWTDPAGGTWWQEHDVDGNPTGSADPTGVRTRITYDQAGRVTAVDDGLVVTGTEHDELGRLVAEHVIPRVVSGSVTADGTTRTLAYDRCGRVIAETGPDGGTTRYAYSAGRSPRARRGALRAHGAPPATTPVGGWPRWWTVPGSGGSCGTTPTDCSSSGSPRRGSSRPSTATPPAGWCATTSPAAAPPPAPTTRRGASWPSPTGPAAGSSPATPRGGSSPRPTRSATPPATPTTAAATSPRSPTRSAAAPSTSTTRSAGSPPPPIRSAGRPGSPTTPPGACGNGTSRPASGTGGPTTPPDGRAASPLTPGARRRRSPWSATSSPARSASPNPEPTRRSSCAGTRPGGSSSAGPATRSSAGPTTPTGCAPR